MSEAKRTRNAAVNAASIRQEPQSWLWTGRLPAAAISVMTGRGGVGKSTLAAAIAAHVTGGNTLAECEENEIRGSIAWFAAEESLASTTIPKLSVAGADMSRVWFPGVNKKGQTTLHYQLPQDIAALERFLRSKKIRLVVFDPLASYVPHVDINHVQSVRGLMSTLSRCSEVTGTAWLLLMHPNKSRTGNVVDRVSGSASLTQTARSVLAVHRCDNEPDVRYVLHLKTNCGSLASTLRFFFSKDAATGIPLYQFDAVSLKTAEDFDAEPQDGVEGDVMRDAITLLRRMLEKDWLPAMEVMKEAKNAGIGERTLRAAKVHLSVQSRRISDGVNSGFWEWGFPTTVE